MAFIALIPQRQYWLLWRDLTGGYRDNLEYGLSYLKNDTLQPPRVFSLKLIANISNKKWLRSNRQLSKLIAGSQRYCHHSGNALCQFHTEAPLSVVQKRWKSLVVSMDRNASSRPYIQLDDRTSLVSVYAGCSEQTGRMYGQM